MKTIFWNVDTQYDFMRENGKLPISGAEIIEGNLEKLTKFARDKKYQIINTADWHTTNSSEFSDNPDYINTFPAHCIQKTKGAEFVPATKPIDPYIVDWQKKEGELSYCELDKTQEIVLYKDAFNIFEGNAYAKKVLDTINPDRIIIYGVATDVCVNEALKGLIKTGREIYVPTDAIKEIFPEKLDSLYKLWEWNGIKLTNTEEVLSSLAWADN